MPLTAIPDPHEMQTDEKKEGNSDSNILWS